MSLCAVVVCGLAVLLCNCRDTVGDVSFVLFSHCVRTVQMPALKCRAAPQGRLHRSTFAVCKCLFVLLLFAGSPSCSVTVGTQWEMYHLFCFPTVCGKCRRLCCSAKPCFSDACTAMFLLSVSVSLCCCCLRARLSCSVTVGTQWEMCHLFCFPTVC